MLKMIRRRMEDDDRGFTLIELMVVVLIIAILIAIAIPTFLGLRSRAQNRSAQSDLRNGLTAAKAFYTDADTFVGFNTTSAPTIEPALNWVGAVTPTQGQVAIKVADAGNVLLVTLSASGTFFGMGEARDATTGVVQTRYCKGDVGTLAACAGTTPAAWA